MQFSAAAIYFSAVCVNDQGGLSRGACRVVLRVQGVEEMRWW